MGDAGIVIALLLFLVVANGWANSRDAWDDKVRRHTQADEDRWRERERRASREQVSDEG